jgi:hypothetical protein
MLYLAQVQTYPEADEVKLRLLAVQKSEHLWALLPDPYCIRYQSASTYADGVLVLIELESGEQVKDIRDATDWILTLIKDFLTSGLSPLDLKREVERAEQWRQSLTLQSQELGRRSLEMEARRDQIHELEENLKQEKRHLEEVTAQFKTIQADTAVECADSSIPEN